MSSKIDIDEFCDMVRVFRDWINSIKFKGNLINQEINFCWCYEKEELLDDDAEILKDALFLKFAELYYNRFKLPVVMVVAGLGYMIDSEYGEMSKNHEANAILAVQGILYEMYENFSNDYDDLNDLIEYFRKNLAERYAE